MKRGLSPAPERHSAVSRFSKKEMLAEGSRQGHLFGFAFFPCLRAPLPPLRKGKSMKEDNDRAGAGRLGGNAARECQSGSDLARAQERK